MQKLTKIAKSLTSFILAAAFLLSNLSGIAAFAAENDLTPSSIQIIATSTESDEPRKFDGYWSGSDFYLAAEDYAKITRYSYEEGSNALRFKLGMKDILIQKGSGTMQILALRYQGKISRIVSMNGQTYLPMSELLPWLNVTVEQDDETAALKITSDSNSLWEYVGDTANYKFNLYQQMQGFTGGTTSLHAIMVTDVVSHVRWDAMFSLHSTSTMSKYDQAVYQDIFYEYSKELYNPDSGYMAVGEASSVLNKAQALNKNISSFEKAFKIDENALILKLDDFLREQYLTEQFGSAVVFLDRFAQLRKAISSLAPVHPYIKAALETMQIFLAGVGTETEYRDFIQYLSKDGEELVATENQFFKLGLENATRLYQNTKSDVENLYFEEFLRLFGKSLEKHASEIYKSMGEIAINLYSGVTPDLYLRAIEGIGAGLDLLFPELSNGFSEMRKMPVYADVSETMWRVSQALLQRDMTAENIGYICQSQMMSLILSKRCYSAFRDVNNGKLFFDDTAKNVIQTNQIDPINTLLAEFSLTTSCRMNDSIEGKDEAQTNIKTVLQSVVEPSSDAIEDEPSSSEETAPSEEVPAESEVVEEPSKEDRIPTAQEIENIYRDFVAQNFSGKYVALKADVTHDGMPELIVVDENTDYEVHGYIYTYYNGTVKKIKENMEPTVLAGNKGGLTWCLEPTAEGWFNMVEEDGWLWQGYGAATATQFYLKPSGEKVVLHSISCSVDENWPEEKRYEEIDKYSEDYWSMTENLIWLKTIDLIRERVPSNLYL